MKMKMKMKMRIRLGFVNGDVNVTVNVNAHGDVVCIPILVHLLICFHTKSSRCNWKMLSWKYRTTVCS